MIVLCAKPELHESVIYSTMKLGGVGKSELLVFYPNRGKNMMYSYFVGCSGTWCKGCIHELCSCIFSGHRWCGIPMGSTLKFLSTVHARFSCERESRSPMPLECPGICTALNIILLISEVSIILRTKNIIAGCFEEVWELMIETIDILSVWDIMHLFCSFCVQISNDRIMVNNSKQAMDNDFQSSGQVPWNHSESITAAYPILPAASVCICNLVEDIHLSWRNNVQSLYSDRNCNQASMSEISSLWRRKWWKGRVRPFVNAINRRKKAHPGTTTRHEKFNNPIMDWRIRKAFVIKILIVPLETHQMKRILM